MCNIIFAIYPNIRGFGYACVELPDRLLDHGIANVRPASNEAILKRVAKQMDYYKPNIVVLRSGDKLPPRAKRIAQVINQITELAVERDIPVHQYSKEQIKFVFERFGATTNYEIAKKLTTWIDSLKDMDIRRLKSYEPEAYYQGLFDALSLAICYGYIDM